VREWLKTLDRDARHSIGHDIKLVELGWPLGMPLVRKLDVALWEIRGHLAQQRIVRVLFTIVGGRMVLLHGFIKKSGKMPLKDFELAKMRRDMVMGEYS
jgi:phage-related protein